MVTTPSGGFLAVGRVRVLRHKKQTTTMSPKTKSYLALSGTLLLGMILGGLITGTIVKKRVNAVTLVMMNEQRFANRLEELIEPTPQQADSVRSLLKKHGSLFTARSREFRALQWRTFDSLKNELQPLLTTEQRERFQKEVSRIDRRQKQ
jgi:hypothetical protein